MSHYSVRASFDADAGVWYVDETNVPGLSTEAASFEELCRKIEVMVPELLEANGLETAPASVPVEITAHTISRLTLSAA